MKVLVKKIKYFSFSLMFFLLFLVSQSDIWAQDSDKSDINNVFTENHQDFHFELKNLRKWDAPVIADLDQDGFLDLILNDHGYSVSVCWNDNGKFAAPFDIIMGDMHGVSVGDIDKDGKLEIIMSRGGGSGSNARNSKMFRVTREREFISLPDFNVPLELMRGRTVKFFDGDNDGDLDLINFAFPDAEKKGESENYVYKNDGKGELILTSHLPPSHIDGQKVLLTDYNGDGIMDMVIYGHKNIKTFLGNGDLTYTETTKKVLPFDIDEVNNIVELDYDNDGDFDLFINRGKGFEIGETFYDATTETWGFFTKRGEFQFEDLEVGEVLNIKNFQSQWPNNDTFFIGESAYDYEFSGETHSGKDMRIVNSDALGFPDEHTKKGAYIGYVGNQKWRLAGFLWAPATGVVLNVKSYPAFEHQKGLSDILLENSNGKFTDVTKKTNTYLEEHTVATTIADFDNNGFSDLLVIRRGDLIHENQPLLYLNRGEGTFEKMESNGLVTNDLASIGMAVESFDYNHDGKIDVVIGNERGKWHLFKNAMPLTKQRNFTIIEVGNSPKENASSLGALVELRSCKSKQKKRVGATGAAYSMSLNSFIHFGLGACTDEIKVIVTWPNGEKMEQKISSSNGKVFIGN